MATITINPVRLQKCVNAAKRAGAPREQLECFLEAGYAPYKWQWMFHAAARAADLPDGPVDIGCGGARGPGKSHAVMSQAALDDCQRVNGLKGLFLRQTGVSAQESFDDLIHKTVRGKVAYRKTKTSLRFPNGSRILLGGFKDESDIDKYIGLEYDFIIVEELTQLTAEKYDKLRGSLRTSKPNWRPRMYTSFNPGGVGHVWVRDRYVIPFREAKQDKTRFIPSTYKENPALNKEYLEYLEGLGGNLGRAWRSGEWDVFAGQYFPEWSHDTHVVAPFALPQTWFRYRSIDPSGREGTTSCHWYAVDQNGRVWCYREYYYGPHVINPKTGAEYEVGRDADEHAKAIAALSVESDGSLEQYKYTVIDTAAFAKAGFSETMSEIYERNGVGGLMPAAKERVVGWNAVHTYLRWNPKTPETPNPQDSLLKIFSTCVNIIRTIPLLQHDDHHPEDVDSDGDDHAADELRYFLRTLRETRSPKMLNTIEEKIQAFKRQQSSPGFDYQYRRK